jgi:hypothetical protein
MFPDVHRLLQIGIKNRSKVHHIVVSNLKTIAAGGRKCYPEKRVFSG